jgi:D-serine dehydratase
MTAAHPLLDAAIGPGWKGYPHDAPALPPSRIAAMGWNVLRGDLPLPLAVIHRDALHGNLRWMAAFARERGVELAPHGKTSLSPQLFALQLREGAWGMTVANVGQLRLAFAAGAQRALIANQVLAANDLAALAELLAMDATRRAPFLVDSIAQIEAIETWRRAPERPFEVLLEIGLDGGRAGCRSHDEAQALARRIRASRALRLVGIECFEGLWASGRSEDDVAMVDGVMHRIATLAAACEAEQLFECDELLLTAGGSAVFDLVADRLRPSLARPVRGVLRSGCYVTHDHGGYQRYLGAMSQRLGCAHGLSAALEVWTLVQSCPEPGLAILTAGKRDVSYDQSMPVPLRICRASGTRIEAAGAGWSVSALTDQHAYLRYDAATDAPRVGDRIALGISHPCTTFDKWRWMALVDDQLNVIGAISTYF